MRGYRDHSREPAPCRPSASTSARSKMASRSPKACCARPPENAQRPRHRPLISPAQCADFFTAAGHDPERSEDTLISEKWFPLFAPMHQAADGISSVSARQSLKLMLTSPICPSMAPCSFMILTSIGS